MDTFLPWAAFGAAALALLLTVRPWAGSTPKDPAEPTDFWKGWTASRARYISVVLIGLLMIGAGAYWSEKLPLMLEVGYGALIGIAAVLASHAAGLALSQRGGAMLVPVGFVAAAGGEVLLFSASQATVFLGLAFGAALAASLVGGTWARTAATLAVSMAAAAVLGSHRDDLPRAAGTAVLLLVLAVPCLGIANAWGEFTTRQSGKPGSGFWPTVIAAALLAGGAKLAASKYLFLNDLFLTAAGAVVSAWFVSWLLRDDDTSDAGPFALACLIWLGWMTVAFGLMKGYGVAISAIAGATLLAFTGGTRALVSIGLVTCYSLYRVFLEEYPKESRAVDVGQHYAVMGIVAGAALPIAIGNWVAGLRGRGNALILTLAAGAIGLGIVLGMIFVVGARGTVGFLVGTSLCSVVVGLSGVFRLGVTTLAAALGTAIVIGFRYVSPYIGLERESKVRILGYCLLAAVILIVLAQWIVNSKVEVTPSESVA